MNKGLVMLLERSSNIGQRTLHAGIEHDRDLSADGRRLMMLCRVAYANSAPPRIGAEVEGGFALFLGEQGA